MGSQSHLRKNEYVAQFPSLQVSCGTEAAKNYILNGFLLGLFFFIRQLFLGILLNIKCSFKSGESVKRNWAMRLSPARVSRPQASALCSAERAGLGTRGSDCCSSREPCVFKDDRLVKVVLKTAYFSYNTKQQQRPRNQIKRIRYFETDEHFTHLGIF